MEAFLRAALQGRDLPSIRQKRRRVPKAKRVRTRAYERDLEALSFRFSKEVAKVTGPIIQRAEKAERRDASIDDLGGVYAEFERLRLRLIRMSRSQSITRIVDRRGRMISASNLEDQERIMAISLASNPPEVQAALAAFRESNVALIESIALQQHDQVLSLVTKAASSGMRARTLRDSIQERFRVSRSRAQLIARDQLLKANSQLTQIRHAEAGVTHYVWITSSDEKVRDRHADLSGTIHAYNDPPVTNEQGDRNHYGEDYQCRCTGSPVLPT